METKKDLLKAIEESHAISAWSKGVKTYAYGLIEELEEKDNFKFYGSPADMKQLLNGADSWVQYSYGGCSLIYDGDICEALCTPSEIKKTRNGATMPNKNENWLDVQARALHQASRLIRRLTKGE